MALMSFNAVFPVLILSRTAGGNHEGSGSAGLDVEWKLNKPKADSFAGGMK